MRVAFDIGGVISKYPAQCDEMIRAFVAAEVNIFIITDMHDRGEVMRTLRDNGFYFDASRVCVADYERYGDAAKAVLLRDLKIDIFIDDHPGYLAWPWPTPAPLRLRVEPDPRRPYWHPTWKCDGGEFGRRCYLDQDAPGAGAEGGTHDGE